LPPQALLGDPGLDPELHVREDGRTPLHFLCEAGCASSSSCARALLSSVFAGCVNAQDNRGFAALHLACEFGHVEVVDLLLSVEGCCATLRTLENATPLSYAAQCNHPSLVSRLLLLPDVDEACDVPNTKNASACFIACELGHAHVVRALSVAAHAIDVNAFCGRASGMAPLHIACAKGHAPAVDALLSSFPQLDVDAPSLCGRPPLMYAVTGVRLAALGHADHKLVRRLLEAGADVMVRGPEGKTALEMARDRGVELCECLMLVFSSSTDY